MVYKLKATALITPASIAHRTRYIANPARQASWCPEYRAVTHSRGYKGVLIKTCHCLFLFFNAFVNFTQIDFNA